MCFIWLQIQVGHRKPTKTYKTIMLPHILLFTLFILLICLEIGRVGPDSLRHHSRHKSVEMVTLASRVHMVRVQGVLRDRQGGQAHLRKALRNRT